MTSGVTECPIRHMGVKSVSDLWHGMASRKSHVSELKNWMPKYSHTQEKILRYPVSPKGVL